MNNTTDDFQEKQESDISSLANDTESKFVHENHATDCNSKFQAYSGESELESGETDLKTDREVEVEPHHNCEKKTDLSTSKTDASQIIADVVESIEQESAPPVAPPRRRKKKKKADGGLQVSTLLVRSRHTLAKWPILLDVIVVSIASKI